MVETDIQLDEADIDRFSGVMDRLVSELGWSPARAGTYAFINLLKSVRASTKKSKKVRTVRTASRKGRERRRFNVENFSNGEKKNFYIYAGSLAEAKKSPFAQVKYSRLAYTSWGWAMRDLFNKGALGNVSFRRPASAVSGFVNKGKGSFSASVENKIKYIRSAFISSGDRTIATAMQRASSSMNGKITKDLIKAAKS